LFRLGNRKVKHTLQGEKRNYAQQKTKPLFYVDNKGKDDLDDLTTTSLCMFCYNGVIVLNKGILRVNGLLGVVR
jgi:hypothetical protein